MRLADFEAMVAGMAGDVPREFLDGVAEIAVSPRALPHPERPGIFTLGECIPLPAGQPGGAADVQSRIVLYHGSFLALARVTPGFEWREEAFETLTHELRHHLEWRAGTPELEQLDWATEQNYARHDGDRFDPVFYLSGAPVGDDAWRVEDDVFLDRVVKALPSAVRLRWAGRAYQLSVPAGARMPAFLVLEGLADPPPGEVVLVLRRKPGLLSLIRPVAAYHTVVRAVEPDGYLPDADGAPANDSDETD
jgi:hypothetical protein